MPDLLRHGGNGVAGLLGIENPRTVDGGESGDDACGNWGLVHVDFRRTNAENGPAVGTVGL